MGLLDDLEKRSAEHKAREASVEEERAQRERYYQEVMQPRFEAIYAFLGEFVSHLTVINPELLVSYRIPGDHSLTDLLQQGYELKLDSREETQQISLRFSCASEGELKIVTENKQGYGQLNEFCFQNKLVYTTKPNRDAESRVASGDIIIQKKVPVHFTFSVDKENSRIVFHIRNFLELGLHKYYLDPDRIDEAFLDELGRFILRETDTFMQLEVDQEQLQIIRDTLEKEREEKENELRIAEEKMLAEEKREQEMKITNRLKNKLTNAYRDLLKK